MNGEFLLGFLHTSTTAWTALRTTIESQTPSFESCVKISIRHQIITTKLSEGFSPSPSPVLFLLIQPPSHHSLPPISLPYTLMLYISSYVLLGDHTSLLNSSFFPKDLDQNENPTIIYEDNLQDFHCRTYNGSKGGYTKPTIRQEQVHHYINRISCTRGASDNLQAQA
ncbi:Hypothetical predicted protein [Pelobates cultripes]|uniref:Uncharacterized protein n=1 Tax=Pelobates cultripes TaxID=61616 RepID=A0AAD1S8D3_PELCU|nr:Hypothetical predicted protein [Pelobates cultripes]